MENKLSYNILASITVSPDVCKRWARVSLGEGTGAMATVAASVTHMLFLGCLLLHPTTALSTQGDSPLGWLVCGSLHLVLELAAGILLPRL